jgi:hypothetical protein
LEVLSAAQKQVLMKALGTGRMEKTAIGRRQRAVQLRGWWRVVAVVELAQVAQRSRRVRERSGVVAQSLLVRFRC